MTILDVDFNDLWVSLEEEANGEFNTEIEHVFYARITDFKQLERADSKVRQEQWEIRIPLTAKNAAKGSFRCRKIKEQDKDPQYVFTTKLSTNEQGDKMEVSLDTTAEQFITFKFLAEQGMIKDRYSFKTESGLIWEVDVFLDPTGGYYQWCKIDLEVKDRNTPIPSFPIDFNDVINGTNLARGSKEDKHVSSLYDKYFLTKNVYKNDPSIKEEREAKENNENKVQEEVLLD